MKKDSAWVIAANMGLGHLRAAYPLERSAMEKIFLFGEDLVSSAYEKRQWQFFRNSYEFLSRTRNLAILGPYLFSVLEKLQNISPYYPFRDQSRPSLQVKALYSLVKKGLGSGMYTRISEKKLPIITSFYAAAIAAEEYTDLPVYCIICDADINRVWVSENPQKSRIIYFVPCGRAMRRLKQYGVPDERIFMTGFPLPDENIGGPSMDILKKDLSNRLMRLDATTRFRIIHGEEAHTYIGFDSKRREAGGTITLTYAVGGAGAQADIARYVIQSLGKQIRADKIRLNLVAGVRSSVYKYFMELTEKTGFSGDKRVNIVYRDNMLDYFRDFSTILHDTDILWTKPSELSFYCGLGLPIIIAPCIGPHEVANKQWLWDIGAGIYQDDVRYCGEWIMDYLIDGRLAQAAWDGFLYARKLGAHKIAEVLETGTMVRELSPVKR